MILHLCDKLGVCYTDNRNITRKHLCKDGLHLVESPKVILANSFLYYLSKCFLIGIYYRGYLLRDDITNTKLGIPKSSAADLEIFEFFT